MVKANVYELKAKLSEYLERAAGGERIVICRHNKPVAEIRAVEDVRVEPRPVGPIPGRPTFEVPASFFEPMSEDELSLWEGGGATEPLSLARAPTPARGASKVAETRAGYGARRPSRSVRRRP